MFEMYPRFSERLCQVEAPHSEFHISFPSTAVEEFTLKAEEKVIERFT